MVEPSEEVPSRLVSGIVLPEDPSVEELARNWSLSEADIREVLFCRGTDNSLRFALQLCVVRCHGRFLEEYDDPPVRIVNHLAAQLHLPPVLLLAPPRPATESLISNAVLVWNTIQIQGIVEGLRASGHPVKDEDLARVSPLLRSHVIPNGSYDLSIR
jgi:hypothetical protein